MRSRLSQIPAVPEGGRTLRQSGELEVSRRTSRVSVLRGPPQRKARFSWRRAATLRWKRLSASASSGRNEQVCVRTFPGVPECLDKWPPGHTRMSGRARLAPSAPLQRSGLSPYVSKHFFRRAYLGVLKALLLYYPPDTRSCMLIVQVCEIPSHQKITSVHGCDSHVKGVFGKLRRNRPRFKQLPRKGRCLGIHLKNRDVFG